MTHSNNVFNLIFLFNFFTIILLLLYIFFNNTQGTTYIKNSIVTK